jgi:hypothetical protein
MKKVGRFRSEISKDRLGSDPGNGTERDKNARRELRTAPFITCHQRVLSHIKISKPLRFDQKHGKPRGKYKTVIKIPEDGPLRSKFGGQIRTQNPILWEKRKRKRK